MLELVIGVACWGCSVRFRMLELECWCWNVGVADAMVLVFDTLSGRC